MIQNLISRLKTAYNAFRSSALTGYLQLQNGLILDISNKRIIIPNDFTFHVDGNLKLSATKHIIIKSGRTPEERPGYIHGVWINSEQDSLGRPLLDKEKIIEAENGNIKHS